MTFGIVVFPGSNCDHDAYHAAKHVLGQDAEFIWHKDERPQRRRRSDPSRRVFLRRLPADRSHRALLADHARRAGLRRPRRTRARRLQRLPDSARGRPDSRRDAAQSQRQVPVRARPRPRRADSTRRSRARAGKGQVLRLPIAHGEGNYFATPDVIARLEANRQIIFRYTNAAGRGDGRGEPERIGRGHRRPVQRGAQRRRPDAASRAGVRVGARQRRRPARVRVGRRVASRPAPWWRGHDRLEGARTARPESRRIRSHRRASWAGSRT